MEGNKFAITSFTFEITRELYRCATGITQKGTSLTFVQPNLPFVTLPGFK